MKAALVVGLVFATTAWADKPPFKQQVQSARKAGVRCATLSELRGEHATEAVVRACQKGKWKLEWIVCVADDYGACEKHLTPAQRKQLAAALEAPYEPPPPPKAEPESSETTTVDRIAMKKGSLADGGAGAARWALRTIDGCLEDKSVRRGGTAKVTVSIGDTDSERAHLAVTGPADMRRCLESRLKQLTWINETSDVLVEMRVMIKR